MATLDQFRGCLLGLALGDALGAPHEGGIVERLVWRIIGRTNRGEMRWTDDTQMTVDLVASYLEKGHLDPDHIATRFATSYRWSRGYGPAAAKVLKRIARGADWRTANRSVYGDGSYGNGAAMRAPILGLICADRPDNVVDAARQTAAVTHAHPIAIEGAILLATATERAANGGDNVTIAEQALARCTQDEFRSRLQRMLFWIETDAVVSAADVTRQLGRGIAAHESCVTAVYLALRFRNRSFLDMQRYIVDVGGDVDTIGAMSGAIWGAANGSAMLPADWLAKLEQREWLEGLAETLFQHVTEHDSN